MSAVPVLGSAGNPGECVSSSQAVHLVVLASLIFVLGHISKQHNRTLLSLFVHNYGLA